MQIKYQTISNTFPLPVCTKYSSTITTSSNLFPNRVNTDRIIRSNNLEKNNRTNCTFNLRFRTSNKVNETETCDFFYIAGDVNWR